MNIQILLIRNSFYSLHRCRQNTVSLITEFPGESTGGRGESQEFCLSP